MASIRSARVLAVAAALPLTLSVLGGVAQADSGGFADGGSNVSVATVAGGGAEGGNFGNSSTSQQVATGWGASNQSESAGAGGLAFTVIDQDNVTVNFSPLW
ncbi:hypothetical protein [Streptomyces xantholiticus]|uniref:hypothetical protein n=1 Tax=Streptomyces xantholiticus TaxID=68285 RepID=UPI0016750458|nr:hypothetical protein [Streptomyces xantholiticus]GGW45556.1 hypothetical protein GCM10010381_33410 [Streptomyces xantholiticus]